MIICLGTTPAVQRTMTFERLELDRVNRAAEVHEFASGKSINAARVLRALGAECIAIGFAGGDRGRFLAADLDRAGIRHDFVEVESSTRLCITVLDRAAGTATELVEEAGAVSPRESERLIDKLMTTIPQATTLILSGTLAAGVATGFSANCITLAGTSIPVILDATGEPLELALERHPMIVKINRAELGQTLDADVDDDDGVRGAMRQIVARGARWVVVTAGCDATFASDGRRFWRITPPRVTPINPIGSGDAFAAGLALGLQRGQEVPQACLLAAACGAANALTPYAGHVSGADVDALLKQTHVIEQ